MICRTCSLHAAVLGRMWGYSNKPDASHDHRLPVRICRLEYIADGIGFASRDWVRPRGCPSESAAEETKKQTRSSCEDRACCLASSLGSKGILDETVAVCRQPVDRCQTLPPRWRLLSESTRSPPFHEKVTRFGWTASASHLAACSALSRTLPRPTGASFPGSWVSARGKMKKNAVF